MKHIKKSKNKTCKFTITDLIPSTTCPILKEAKLEKKHCMSVVIKDLIMKVLNLLGT